MMLTLTIKYGSNWESLSVSAPAINNSVTVNTEITEATLLEWEQETYGNKDLVIDKLASRIKLLIKHIRDNRVGCGGGLSLTELENKLDAALEKETAASLKAWLKSKRK